MVDERAGAGTDLSRRTFLGASGLGAGAAALGLGAGGTGGTAYAGVAAFADRGTPTEYTGAALGRIGMPVGGGCSGQVYLAGDGRLWAWDIFNQASNPIGSGAPEAHYAAPLTSTTFPSPFKQGFAIRTTANGTTKTRTLDATATGFSDVTFVGQYPIGRVTYTAPDSPVEVTLEAFSPFVPLQTNDSTIPATVMAFTVRNTSASEVDATLLGFAENPACLFSRAQQPTRLRATAYSGSQLRGVEHTAVPDVAPVRPDIVFEDWERDTYAPWTTTGDAFGPGPVVAANVPEHMKRFGDLNVTGTRFVTSHNYRLSSNTDVADSYQGTLTSPEFTIERRFVTAYVGGGNHAGTTCVNVLVDGQVVASATGADTEVVTAKVLDVTAHQGKRARIQLVDQLAGHWAHVNVDSIVFGDRADVLFEDWEKNDYAGWTVTGNAFGSGPVSAVSVPSNVRRFGDLNLSGTRFVTSYNYRLAGDPDGHQGTLTSAPFKITRRYVSVGIGGGNHPGTTCVNVLVGGQVVASATGANSEPMVAQQLDVSAYEGRTAQLQVVDAATGPWAHLNCDVIWFTDSADVLFENWERTNWDGWTVSGNAWGPRPMTPEEMPEWYRRAFGEISDLNVSGARYATSYNISSPDADGFQGTLTSRTFAVTKRYVTVWVGGGPHKGKTCVNVVVGGQVVGTCTGQEIEPMQAVSMDVGRWIGQNAQIQLVDSFTGGWGHLNVDRIILSDRPIRSQPLADRTDGGSFSLAALDDAAVVKPSIANWSTVDALFDSAAAPAEVPGASPGLAGTVSVAATLAAGASRTVPFAFGWFYPNPERKLFSELVDVATLRHHYVTRFASAQAVVRHVASNLPRTEALTRAWVKSLYADSTLPHWFVERTFANTSTVATITCYRFESGRFYAWEGSYWGVGTCGHVWNYAQAIGRMFPELERDARERVDLGIAFRPTGEIGNRGECWDPSSSFADGQCGVVLRIFREHQMTGDNAFLTRVWPKVRTALEFLVTARDVNGDGIFSGSQWNTLDTDWFGEVPWLSGLYVAALRAGAAMATELGDTSFAQRYTTLAERGTAFIDTQLWNPTYGYYVQRVDPAHPNNMNANRGSYIDHMYGQTFARQLGLPRVMPADKSRTALSRVYSHNFLPNPAGSRDPNFGAGRTFSMPGEPGMIMGRWPHGGANQTGQGWQVTYFNEVWSGQEWQFAAHLFDEGLVNEGLTLSRAVYDRYHASKRNPYNEIEYGDHYARAMMSYGTYLSALGYEYHGPRGHLGFAPKLTPEDFAAAFTAAEGWGLYRQTRVGRQQLGTVELRFGKLRVSTLAFETAGTVTAAVVRAGGAVRESTFAVTGNRVVVTLATPVTLDANQALMIKLDVDLTVG